MPSTHTEPPRSGRIELRATPGEKTLLARAAAMERLDLTGFVMRAALPAARQVIEREQQVNLSERDTLRALDLLEHPPQPNEKLAAAAAAWIENRHRRSDA